MKYLPSNTLVVTEYFPPWGKLRPGGIVRPVCKNSMAELSMSNESWSERCRALAQLKNWRTKSGDKGKWDMPRNITFRYMVLLRYTDEGICVKQSRKAMELCVWGGRWCAYVVHIVLNCEAKAKPLLRLMSTTVILGILGYINANFTTFHGPLHVSKF